MGDIRVLQRDSAAAVCCCAAAGSATKRNLGGCCSSWLAETGCKLLRGAPPLTARPAWPWLCTPCAGGGRLCLRSGPGQVHPVRSAAVPAVVGLTCLLWLAWLGVLWLAMPCFCATLLLCCGPVHVARCSAAVAAPCGTAVLRVAAPVAVSLCATVRSVPLLNGPGRAAHGEHCSLRAGSVSVTSLPPNE